MKIETFTERRLRTDDPRIWFSSCSWQSDYDKKWSNCLYINFCKEDFPNLNYPKIKEGYFDKEDMRFDYYESDLANLDWHGGITFYEEKFYPDTKKTLIKAGCDYQHFGDDYFRASDNGELILKRESLDLMKEFLELVKPEIKVER